MCREVQDWDWELEHSLNVDQTGRMAFMTLAQQSWACHVEAIAVAGKLVKKISEGKPADNPSVFVTVGCQTAMPDFR